MLKQFTAKNRSACQIGLRTLLVCQALLCAVAAACSGAFGERVQVFVPCFVACGAFVGTLFFGVFCFVVPRYIVIRALSAIWQTSKSLVLLTSRGDNDIAGER